MKVCHHRHEQDSHDAFEVVPDGYAHLIRPSLARWHTLCINCRNVSCEKERIAPQGFAIVPEINTLCETRNAIRQRGWKKMLDRGEWRPAIFTQFPLVKKDQRFQRPCKINL